MIKFCTNSPARINCDIKTNNCIRYNEKPADYRKFSLKWKRNSLEIFGNFF